MLGSLSEADDAVQDAWIRVSRADATAVDNLGGWLTTIVAGICLNRLRTRRRRPEESLDAFVPDAIVRAEGSAGPEDVALLGDAVGLALMIVLETLSPAERLAFVLHDLFDLPFVENVGVTSTGHELYARFDSVIVRGMPYRIASIHAISREAARTMRSADKVG